MLPARHFYKINKSVETKKCMKHTADSGAFLLCPDSTLRSKQKAQSGAARKRGEPNFPKSRTIGI